MFSNTHPHLFDKSLFGIEEGIEEVNFKDLALVHGHILSSAPNTLAPPVIQGGVVTGVSRNPAPRPGVQRERTPGATLIVEAEPSDRHVIKVTTQATITKAGPEQATIPTKPPPPFFIDTNPSMSQNRISVPAYHVHSHTGSLGENVQVEVDSDLEDDVIIYDAPNPRMSTPRVEPSALANVSSPNHDPPSPPRLTNTLRRGKFVHVVGKNAKRGGSGVTGVKRKRLVEHKNFAEFGTMIAEVRLRSQDGGEDKDPKEHMRRQGDSDLDWGDETDEDEKEKGPVAVTAEGMDLDPDLVGSGVTVAAMESFAEGINGDHATIDDLEDDDTDGDSRPDDSDGNESQGGSEDRGLESDEERMLIEEINADQSGSDFSDDDDDDDAEGLDPMADFQARLDRLRKKQQKIIEMGDDENEDEMDPDFQWREGQDIDVCIIPVPGSRNLRDTFRTLSKKLSITTRRTGRRAMRSLGPFRMDLLMSRSRKVLRRVSCRPPT